jgi:hypothetical protein
MDNVEKTAVKASDRPAEKDTARNEAKLFRLLIQAAELAAKMGVPPEAFTNAAFQAYLRASPDFAERLAEMQFDAMLEQLRSSGRLAKA